MSERGGRSQAIGDALRAQARQMFHAWHRVRDGTLTHAQFRVMIGPIRREVARLLKAGQTCGVAKTEGVCREVLKLYDALWTFVRVEGVEPTNNAAERAIRPGVLWRKGSFGTQSAQGSRFVEAMMTVVTTLKQQHRNVLAYMADACQAAYAGAPAPSSCLVTPRSKKTFLLQHNLPHVDGYTFCCSLFKHFEQSDGGFRQAVSQLEQSIHAQKASMGATGAASLRGRVVKLSSCAGVWREMIAANSSSLMFHFFRIASDRFNQYQVSKACRKPE